MARLTLARKIVTLIVWKKGVRFDAKLVLSERNAITSRMKSKSFVARAFATANFIACAPASTKASPVGPKALNKSRT